MFWRNIQRRIAAIIILLQLSRKKGINTVAKSAYFRSAIMLISTVIEGMVYQLVKEHTKINNDVVDIKKELKKIHSIPDNVFKQKDICICRENGVSISIDNKGVTFEKLNRYLKRHKLVNAKEFEQLDFVRTERNRLHLQGLVEKDTGYTVAKVNRVSKPMDFLSKKLYELNSRNVGKKTK